MIAAQIPAIAQEVVTVRGGSHSEFGRTSSIDIRPSDTMRKFLVEICRAFRSSDASGFSRHCRFARLRLWCAAFRRQSNGNGIVKGRFPNLKTFENDPSIVVDVVRKNGASHIHAKCSRPSLRVRRGQHAEYDRLVFDWTRLVEYEVSRNGGRARKLLVDRRASTLDSIAFGSRV